MVLSFNDLKKREVINVADGRSFGKPIDIRIEFPKGLMTGIVVHGARRKGVLGLFCRSEIFIEDKNIIKIGGDVILIRTGTPEGVSIDKGNGKKNGNCGCVGVPPALPCPPDNFAGIETFDDDSF